MQFSTDRGATWAEVGRVAPRIALLLGPAAHVPFVPAAGSWGTAALSFRAWDGTTGVEGDRADATRGTAFSLDTETAFVAAGNATPSL